MKIDLTHKVWAETMLFDYIKSESLVAFLMSGSIDDINYKQDPKKVLAFADATPLPAESGKLQMQIEGIADRTGTATWIFLCHQGTRPILACSLNESMIVTMGSPFIVTVNISSF